MQLQTMFVGTQLPEIVKAGQSQIGLNAIFKCLGFYIETEALDMGSKGKGEAALYA